MSLYETEKRAAAVAKGPRISLKDIEDQIVGKFELTGDQLIPYAPEPALSSLKLMTLCVLVMKNGFIVIGMSASLSPENYNFAFGHQLAYEDAIRQLWPLMAYSAKDKKHAQ